MFLRGKWVDTWSAVKSCLPFTALMAVSVAMGWWGVVGGVLGTFAALVGYFSLYSFGVASPVGFSSTGSIRTEHMMMMCAEHRRFSRFLSLFLSTPRSVFEKGGVGKY